MKGVIIKALLLVMPMLAAAQPKKKITEADYHKWGELKWEKLSPDARWIAFTMDYAIGNDTLFLQEVKTGKRLVFPNGKDYSFTPDSKWFLNKSGGQLVVKSLDGKVTEVLSDVKKHAFDKASAMLAILQKDNRLLLLGNSSKREVIPNVSDFAFSAKGWLATVKGNEILVGAKTVHSASNRVLTNLAWDTSGTRLAFFSTSGDKADVLMHDLLTGYSQSVTHNAAMASKLLAQRDRSMFFTPDSQGIFLYAKATDTVKLPDDSMVQVWEASNKLSYTEQREYITLPSVPKLVLWDLPDNQLKQLAADGFQDIKLLPGRQMLLRFNRYTNRERPLPLPLADYSIVDLQSGEESLLGTNLPTDPGMRPSPDGRFLGYRSGQQWQIYNCATKSVTTVDTQKWVRDSAKPDYNQTDAGLGWTDDSRYMLVQSGDEIGLLGTNGASFRMTRAKELNAKFRIVSEIHKTQGKIINEELLPGNFSLSRGIFFQATMPDKTTRVYKYTPKQGLIKLYQAKGKATVTAASDGYSKLLITEQTAAIPNQLALLDVKSGKIMRLYQSNAHYKNYETPVARLLSYTSPSGEPLNAVLHYPSDYTPGKKYPMVVYIYEKLSHHLHSYNNPTMYYQIGFAPANYTNDGYFVLYPDIAYAGGDPGTTMVECVLAAVDTALGTGGINSNRVGIMGHSYGGHEVSLLLTRTDIFAAAVAGAGVTNMVSDYLRLYEKSGYDKMWRYEAYQFRMNAALFDNVENYLKNSAVLYAAKITTPLLSWTGKEDESVDYRQSVELHLALKRLNKKNTLLLYPNEGHIINDPEARYDLTVRTKKWFDHYLK